MVGTFPLNVQAGSPQYTLTSQITPTSSTTIISVTNTDSIEPISNAYYTIQNEDGSKWCTFYVSNWRVGDLPKTYNLLCTYTSSNTSDVFPEGSICWCIWCKEYYDSLVTHSGGVQNVTAVYSPISGNNNYVSMGTGSMILPFIPGVTYSGQLRCAGLNSTPRLLFMDDGYNLISEVTVNTTTSNPSTITIPDGTRGVVNVGTDTSYRRICIYPHTVTYQYSGGDWGGGGEPVIKSIEYDLPTTTFTITDTNDQVSEINTSPSVAGADRPPYNISGLIYDNDGTPLLRFGYNSGSGVKNISDMSIVTPVISQTHEIYFDVSGSDLYVRRESPGGMYDLFSAYSPIEEGKGSVVVRWRMCDAIRFHIPEDNFGTNYSVNISCNPMVRGWRLKYIYTDTHASGESNMGGNDELPRGVLGSASNIVWIYTNTRGYGQSELDGAYEIYEVTISISRRS